MKNKILKLLFLSMIVLAYSCNKRLDVQPTQTIDESEALKTSADVLTALTGSYTELGNINFYGGRMFVMGELLANENELLWSGTFQGMTQIYNKNIPVNNGFALNTWLAGYRAINIANNVLSGLPVVVATAKDRVEGEAKFLRAASYFELVKAYAKDWNNGDPASNDGVPLILTPTRGISAADQVPRAKVAAVYTQVIQDLIDAEAKLPVSNGFFASKTAAAALLARVYLQKRDYTNARDAANRVIISNRYSLRPTYAAAFPYNNAQPFSNTSEDVFALQVTLNSGVNDFQTFFSADGRGDIDISDDHLNLYEAGDERLDLFYLVSGICL